MWNRILVPIFATFALGLSAAHAQNNWVTPGGSQANGAVNMCLNGSGLAVPCGSAATPMNITGSFSSAPFDNSTRGTPITATVAGQTGSLPATDTVVIQNVGAFPAWCQPGSLSTNITYGKLLSASGGQWAFARGAATDIFCEGIGGTTTINLQGGTGLAVDTGGGSGGGSGNQGTKNAGAAASWYVQGADAAGASPTSNPFEGGGLVRSGPIVPSTWTNYSEGVVQPLNIDNDGNLRVEQNDWTDSGTISTVTVTATFGTNTISGLTAAEFTAGSVVVFTGGSVPAGLSVGTPYRIVTASSTVATISTVDAYPTPLTFASGASSTAGQGLLIPVSDSMSTMTLGAIFSGGGTLSFLSTPTGNVWAARNWQVPSSGFLDLTMSASNDGKFNVSGAKYVVPYVSTGTAAQTITINWHQSAANGMVAISSPVPNGSNTIGAVTQAGGPWTTNTTTWAGGTLGAMANYGTSPGTVLVPGVNAAVTISALPNNAAQETGGNLATLVTNTAAGVAAPGAATPASIIAMGAVSSGGAGVGVLRDLIQADASAAINVSTATTTQLVAAVASKAIYVTSFDVVAGGTGNISFEYGSTGGSCASPTALTGAYVLTAQSGIAKGGGLGPVLVVPAGNALCVLTTQAVQMSGSISYAQF